MKTFLKHLKTELIKLKFKPQEIDEILEDHKEMIEAAINDGLSDEDLVLKFGDPKQLAKDLYDNLVEAGNPLVEGGTNVEGYTKLHSFAVLEHSFNVYIGLISEDIKYEVHDLETIDVYYKKIEDLDNYTISFDNESFILKRNKEMKLFKVRKESGKFIVRVPQGVEHDEFNINVVSADAKIEAITTKSFSIKTTSGDIKVHQFSTDNFTVSTVSGDVKLYDGKALNATLSMVSGDLDTHNCTIEKDVTLNTVSGDFKAENTHAGAFDFKTVSGDCKGKDFYPKSISFRSVSGDVKIENTNKDFEIEIVSKKVLSGKVKIR